MSKPEFCSWCLQTVKSQSHEVHKTLQFVPLAPACVVCTPFFWSISAVSLWPVIVSLWMLKLPWQYMVTFNWIALHYHTDWMDAAWSCGLYLRCWKIWLYRHCQCLVCYCFQALLVAYTKVLRVLEFTGTKGLDPIVCNIASTRILAKMDKYIIAWGCHIHHPSSIEDTCWPGLANACSLVSEAL
jgi:hypothetical protein